MKQIAIACFCLAAGTCVQAQNINVQPVPQQVIQGNKQIELAQTYQLWGEADANLQAVKALKALLSTKQPDAKGVKIYIGERGDKAIRPFAKKIPQQKEGYYLSVSDKGIVLAGNDERGTFYALQTLTQLLKNNSLPMVEITDYPDLASRGVVEGFYGTPWSHEARLRQLHFYGQYKMNTYIYGPKNDPYHSSPNWRLPYPEQEAKQLQELVKVAHENEVDFVWAIHPGQDIKWNQEDRDKLLAKFDKMYDLGIRSFAVFFDDIVGEGTNAERQAELLNYLDESFVKVKKDVNPLIMCPTEYNKSWSKPEKRYLTTLGDKLNPGIEIMWTGDKVVCDITKEGVLWINERIKRPAYIWWNFPVSDYVRDHLLMGPVYGNDLQIAKDMSGFVTNPMEHAEASKISIYSVASYSWNLAKYDSNRTWKDAICAILPGAAAELEFFANHNADLGPNGHQFRREESVELQPVAQRFLTNHASLADRALLEDAFQRMQEVSDILAVTPEDTAFTNELLPWLYQFKALGETGEEVLAMLKAFEDGDQSLFLRKYKHVKALQLRMFQIDQIYNQNRFQPGVKTASKVIKPLIDKVFETTTLKYNEKYGTALDATTDYMPHKLISNVAQLKNQPLRIKMNTVQVSPSLEVVKWQTHGFLMIELEENALVQKIDLDLGQPEVTWGILEVSADGNTWEKVEFKQNKNAIAATLDNRSLKAVRFTHAGDKEVEIYLKKFVITMKK